MFNKLFKKRKSAISITEKLQNIWTALFFQCVLFLLSQLLVYFVGKIAWQVSEVEVDKYPYGIEFLLSCIVAPLWEEVVFRVLPVQILLATGYYKKLAGPVLVAACMIFGYMHDHPFSIMVQGIGGLCTMWLYVRNGFCYWSAVSLHALWNLMCIFYS